MSAERLGARYIRKLEKPRSDLAIELFGFMNRICVRPTNLHFHSSIFNFLSKNVEKMGSKSPCPFWTFFQSAVTRKISI